MRRREFITLLGGAVVAWPAGGTSATYIEAADDRVSWRGARLLLGTKGWWHSHSGSANSAGLKVALSRLIIAGRMDVVTSSTILWPTSSSVGSMSSSRRELRQFSQSGRQLRSYRLSLRRSCSDPVGSGLVDSLARPGGNATGLSLQQSDLAAKRLELLRQVLPNLRTLAIMANAGAAGAMLEMREVVATARTLGIDAKTIEIRRVEDISPAFEVLKGHADALFGVATTFCDPQGSNQHFGHWRTPSDNARSTGAARSGEVSCLMDRTLRTCSDARPTMPTKSYVVENRPISLLNSRLNSSGS